MEFCRVLGAKGSKIYEGVRGGIFDILHFLYPFGLPYVVSEHEGFSGLRESLAGYLNGK